MLFPSYQLTVYSCHVFSPSPVLRIFPFVPPALYLVIIGMITLPIYSVATFPSIKQNVLSAALHHHPGALEAEDFIRELGKEVSLGVAEIDEVHPESERLKK